jgi:hypothetical protein
MDAATKEQQIKAKEQELKLQFKSAPRKVRWVLNTGWLVALLILLSYGALAFEGYVGWIQAALRAALQAALYIILASGVAFGRQHGTWWALAAFAALHSFGALGGLLRMTRLAAESGLNWRDGIVDVITVARLATLVFLIALLLTRDVRDYVFVKKDEKVAAS